MGAAKPEAVSLSPPRRPLPCSHAAPPPIDSAVPSGIGEPVRFPRLPPTGPSIMHVLVQLRRRPQLTLFTAVHRSESQHRRGLRGRQSWSRASCSRGRAVLGVIEFVTGLCSRAKAASAFIAGSFAASGWGVGSPPGHPGARDGAAGRAARRQPRCRRAPHACPVLCALVVVAHDHESMGARPCDGDFSCPDRMLFYRCSGPLMPCDGGAHAPPERRLCGFEIWAFWSLSSLMKPSDLSSEIVSEIVQISVIVSRFQYV